MPDRSPRRRIRHAGIFAIIVAAQFGVFEAAMRVWGSSEAAPAFQGLFVGDPTTGYRLKPGGRTRFTTPEFDTQIAINRQGVRDDEDVGPKAAGERRIVILGDSLVLSVQVPFEQTFGELLEKRLNARGGHVGYRVINAGVQGYGPVEALLFFRDLAGTLDPDVVVATVFVGNDAEEAVTSEPRLDPSARSAAAATRDSLSTALRRTVRRSMVLQVLRLRASAATGRVTVHGGPPEPPLQSYAASPAARIHKGIAITKRCIEAIAADAAARGARTAVLLMPARLQVDDADYERLRAAVREAGGLMERDAATRRFDEALRDSPLPRLDVLPALRAALPGPDLFFQQTVHLTPRGHEIVAAALETFLADHGLLDRGTAPGDR